MSILLLVVVLLVVAIVLSRLTWASLGERQSIRHHEQAMDVLRSVSGRPVGPDETEVEEHGGAHVKSSAHNTGGFPAPADTRAVPEATAHRDDTIRILRAEPTGAAPSNLEAAEGRTDPAAASAASTRPAPPPTGPPAGPDAAEQPAGVEARPAGAGSGPSWEPADSRPRSPDLDGDQAKPAFVFIADDSGQPGPITVPPSVADAVRRSGRGRWGDGRSDGQRRTNGGRVDEPRPADEPAAAPSVLPRPPSLEEQEWSASSRSEARSRSRARTRSRLWGRVLAPVHATGRMASEARGRLGSAHRPVPPAGDVARADDGWLGGVPGEPTGEGVTVMTADAPPVATGPERGEAVAETAPSPAAPAGPPPSGPPPGPDRDWFSAASDGVGTAAFDGRQAEQPGPPFLQRSARARRRGVVVGLATVVVVVCVVAGVLVATMSGSSNSSKAPPSRQASPPARPAPGPAPAPSPLTLVSHDDNGAVYNLNAGRVSLSAVASGRVWIEVVSGTGPYGQVLWQGILTDGQSQQVTNDAPVWVRIGAASNVAVTVNGGGVVLPQSPTTYNLTFSQA